MFKVCLMLLVKPKLLIQLLRPMHIKNFVYLLFFAPASERYRVLNHYRMLTGNEPIFDVVPEAELREPSEPNIVGVEREIPAFESIDVSIVIPVYNQWEMTDRCIRSIISTVNTVKYEIILADDCSDDETAQAGSKYKNLIISRTDTNQGFLLNCNLAAKTAKGRYIVFLNNDTIVHANWLSSLFDCMEKDESIAIVGSKLVYPDGSLQEAGGIIWNNGDGWNYGRNDDPGKPEYNYVKEVDYISGASIMVRTSFWCTVDGFDTRFTPAYYEDTDLAFQAAEHGFKVIYHPHSVVTHFEGKSHGTSESSGIKAYQAENRIKFLEKWNSKLSTQHFPPSAKRLFNARDKSGHKRTILFIDHYVPWFDQDAGSRSTMMYIEFLVEEGYNVKFIGDNFFPHQPYTSILQGLGVEVLYGNYYAEHWQDWIVDHGTDIDVVYLHRPHIAPKYIDFIAKNTRAKIVYQCHDLHHVRIKRLFERTQDSSLISEIDHWEKAEKALFEKADVGLTFSLDEKHMLLEWGQKTLIEQVPLFLYDEKCVQDESPFTSRKNILFVGGFNHKPNAEGVQWFLTNVFPHICQELPNIEVHIAGSKANETLGNIKQKNVIIHDRVSDQRLEQLYTECKVNILPLLHGAGVKGKLIESMRYGTPVISTSVGLEGINAEKYGFIGFDTPKAFAGEILELLISEEYWNANKWKLNAAFLGNFSKQKFKQRVKDIF